MAISEKELEALLPRLTVLLYQWAKRQLEPRLHESVVQQTLLETFRDRAKIAGTSPGEVMAFAKTVLVRNVHDKLKALGRICRDEDAEVPFDDDRADGVPLAGFLSQSPEGRAIRLEQMVQFLAALQKLPPDDAEIIELRIIQGMSVGEIARQVGKPDYSVSRSYRKSLEILRGLLSPAETSVS